jgi:serine/threonine protein kinase
MPRHPETNKLGLLAPRGYCGKKNYVAPEIVVNGAPFSGHCVDLWAIASMLFILVTGVPPVDLASVMDARYNMIVDGKLALMLRNWGIQLSEELTDLLQNLFREKDRERLSIEQILSHSWFR